jgi:hypothetical protein
MNKNDVRAPVVAALLASLAALSCAKVSGGGSAPPADEGGNVTAAGPPAQVAPAAPSSVSNVAKEQVATPVSPEATPTPAPAVEAPVAPPSPSVVEAVGAAQGRLDALAAGLAGTRVRFVDCAAMAACSARLEAQSLAGLRDLLQAVSAQQGGIAFSAREQLDAYTGRTFVADVSWGGGESRAVPSDETQLLGN